MTKLGPSDTAKRIGLRRVEADVLSKLARLALGLGDFKIAQQRAMACLRIANEMPLGLKDGFSSSHNAGIRAVLPPVCFHWNRIGAPRHVTETRGMSVRVSFDEMDL